MQTRRAGEAPGACTPVYLRCTQRERPENGAVRSEMNPKSAENLYEGLVSGDRARPGRCHPAPRRAGVGRAQSLNAGSPRPLPKVAGEGATHCARGGRAPPLLNKDGLAISQPPSRQTYIAWEIASTGPRSIERGMLLNILADIEAAYKLQRGRAQLSAECGRTRRPPLDTLLLQRGRAQLSAECSAELAHALVCYGASTGPRSIERGMLRRRKR